MLKTAEEILILLEDEGEIPLFRLQRWGKRKAAGALAQLEKRGLALKAIHAQGPTYKLTTVGRTQINQILIALHQKRNNSNQWLAVLYNLPESDRQKRDQLRRSLNNLNLINLDAGFWITPHINTSNKIQNFIKKYKAENQAIIITIYANPDFFRYILSKINIENLNKEYKNFIQKVDKLLKVPPSHLKTYEIKKIIYLYAKTLASDPFLPENYYPVDYLQPKAHQKYKELKSLL